MNPETAVFIPSETAGGLEHSAGKAAHKSYYKGPVSDLAQMPEWHESNADPPSIEDGVRTGVSGLIKPIPTDETAFRTTYLTYNTVRSIFNFEPFKSAIKKDKRFKWNLLAVVGSGLLLILFPSISVLHADRKQEDCVFRENEMETLKVYDYHDSEHKIVQTYVKNPSNKYPRPDKSRGKETCELIIDAHLEERESLIRDYVGPLLSRVYDTASKRECGYFNKPEDIGVGQPWSVIYALTAETGFHYGSPPPLTTKPEKDEYVYVCVMKPIKILVLGTEYIVEYLSLAGIAVFIIAYLLGPGAHQEKCFTIAIVGNIMVAGMGTAIATVFFTEGYVWSLKSFVSCLYSKEIATVKDMLDKEAAKNAIAQTV